MPWHTTILPLWPFNNLILAEDAFIASQLTNEEQPEASVKIPQVQDVVNNGKEAENDKVSYNACSQGSVSLDGPVVPGPPRLTGVNGIDSKIDEVTE